MFHLPLKTVFHFWCTPCDCQRSGHTLFSINSHVLNSASILANPEKYLHTYLYLASVVSSFTCAFVALPKLKISRSYCGKSTSVSVKFEFSHRCETRLLSNSSSFWCALNAKMRLHGTILPVKCACAHCHTVGSYVTFSIWMGWMLVIGYCTFFRFFNERFILVARLYPCIFHEFCWHLQM